MRSVIVTGGFGALGHVVAQAFVAESCRVARVDFAAEPTFPLPGSLAIGSMDLTKPADARTVMDRVVDEFGGLDVLVNVAGGFVWETLAEGSMDSWSRMYAMNLSTAATMTQAALPRLAESNDARIVNIGAGAAVKAGMGMGAYAASKSAVHRLTEALAEETAGTDITVNAVLPSIIDTPTNREDMPDADTTHWVKPEAIAEVIVFLASPQARAITGALIPVTRGG